MTDEQMKLTSELEKQRADLVRALRRMADMFADEMSGPKAGAVGWIYRAAAELLNGVSWAQFAEVAKETVSTTEEPRP
jgi:hypothetical protein